MKRYRTTRVTTQAPDATYGDEIVIGGRYTDICEASAVADLEASPLDGWTWAYGTPVTASRSAAGVVTISRDTSSYVGDRATQTHPHMRKVLTSRSARAIFNVRRTGAFSGGGVFPVACILVNQGPADCTGFNLFGTTLELWNAAAGLVGSETVVDGAWMWLRLDLHGPTVAGYACTSTSSTPPPLEIGGSIATQWKSRGYYTFGATGSAGAVSLDIGCWTNSTFAYDFELRYGRIWEW